VDDLSLIPILVGIFPFISTFIKAVRNYYNSFSLELVAVPSSPTLHWATFPNWWLCRVLPHYIGQRSRIRLHTRRCENLKSPHRCVSLLSPSFFSLYFLPSHSICDWCTPQPPVLVTTLWYLHTMSAAAVSPRGRTCAACACPYFHVVPRSTSRVGKCP
jgi:hypothetical protein